MRGTAGYSVKSDATLEEFDCPNLHPAYQHLNFTHRSDYLRIFLAVHVGGAYVDPKPLQTGITPFIDLLNQQRDKDFLGQRVAGLYTVGRGAHSACKREWAQDHTQIPCTCLGFFVSKTGGKFVTKFLRQMDALLTEKQEQLALYPGRFARHVTAKAGAYPLGWTSLLGDVAHKLQIGGASKHCHFVPRNSVILEGQPCSSYRGLEGDGVAQLWIPVCDTNEIAERARKQIRYFNGREFPKLLVSQSPRGKWAIVSRVCEMIQPQPFQGKMAFLFREWSAEELMLHAKQMLDSLKQDTFYVSEDSSALIIAQKLIPKLRTFLAGCNYNVTREALVKALEAK